MGWSNTTGWTTGAGGWNKAAGVATAYLYTYDFLASPSLPATLSLSRATTGTNFNSSGTMVTAAINAARFENTYNGTSWIAAGLLVEEQRTNILAPYSDAYWNPQGVSLVSGATTPSGVTGLQFIEAATTDIHGVYNTAGYSPTVGIATSVYAKETGVGAKRYFNLSLNAPDRRVTFNIATGAVTENIGGTTAFTVNVGNGWRRLCVQIGAASWLVNAAFVVNTPTPWADGGGNTSAFTYTGDGVSGMNVFAVSFNDASFVETYIPTTTSTAVTRSADLLSSTGTLTTQLAAGPSVWELTDLATGTISRTSFAAGTFTFPNNKLYRSFAVYPPGFNTAPYLTVGGPYT